ncbi:MAG: class I SAM-dependent methyltransferase [Candidatus Heimdallarchaeota archaeon]
MNSKQYFDDVANNWDKMREGFFSKTVRDKAFSIAGVQKDKLAADIGAGTGFITEGLIRKGVQVIVVDQSEKMLAEMKKKFAQISGIDYRVGEAEKLPIPNETVDYSFANMYLHHVESPPKAIEEMVRILKSGGKLVITDLDEHHFEFLKEEHHDRWMGFKREDIKRWFEATGLKNVIVDCVGESCCAQSNDRSERADISIFVASGER